MTQLANQTVTIGQTATFIISASGAGPLTYLWKQNGTAISGVTANTYTTPPTTTLGTSAYTVSVTNPAGTVTSATATLTVIAQVPTLSFATIPSKPYGTAPFAVSATSASSGAVNYAVLSGPAIVAGNIVTLTATGAVVLSASQAAEGDYAAATATTSFQVVPAVTISPVTPANLTVAPGTQTFTATPSSGGLVWTASGGTITPGGIWTSPNTAATYSITATSAQQPGLSVSTTVTISKPVITAQPASKNVCSGSHTSLSIAANYATSYQWTLNGSPLATGPTLTFAGFTSAGDGAYLCTATNAAGSVSSNAAVLNVLNPIPLTITSQPSPLNVFATQTATFAVAATGNGPLTYQWFTGPVGSGVPISGATSNSYTTPALTGANSGARYYVTVTDPNCTGTTLTSTTATVSVTTADIAVPPTILVQPTGQTAPVNGTATFSVVASGLGSLTYQWFRVAYSGTELSAPTAGVAVDGATSSTYTVPSTETAQSNDGDDYYVVVKNEFGSAASNRAILAVGAGILLQIIAQPQTAYVASGALASFSVTATCTGCISAYQWYWYAPGSSTATALANGAVSSGALSGGTVAGATTSSLTLENVPAAISTAVFYVVVTSTSDGTTATEGTNPLTSTTAGLFVGSVGTVGNTSTGGGLCNNSGSGTGWALNGTNPGTSPGDVPYQNTSACTIELTNDLGNEHASVYWPTLISTNNFSVSFTVAISATGKPADGFTMVLADPSQGATTSSLGNFGEGLGAEGIPGFVLGFDTYQNGDFTNNPTCGATPPCDPVPVPYMAVGQGASPLWENPWTYVNGNLNTLGSANYPIDTFANASHNYVVTVVNGIMTATIDGQQLFSGAVSLPPVAYLGFTASTGTFQETVTLSGLTATISPP